MADTTVIYRDSRPFSTFSAHFSEGCSFILALFLLAGTTLAFHDVALIGMLILFAGTFFGIGWYYRLTAKRLRIAPVRITEQQLENVNDGELGRNYLWSELTSVDFETYITRSATEYFIVCQPKVGREFRAKLFGITFGPMLQKIVSECSVTAARYDVVVTKSNHGGYMGNQF